MVLHGCGPLVFEDENRCMPRAFLCGDVKVPEFTKSDTKYWEAVVLKVAYYPPELFEFIRNESAAAKFGWNVAYSRRVISNAMDIRTQAGVRYEWEFYQQELKQNALAYYDDTKVCRVCHVFWREFDGRITHAIVEQETTTNKNSQPHESAAEQKDTQFLFMKVGRYGSFDECVHPMYFDRGNGGFHHSVTGLGVKMYGAMEYQNRLMCNLADKAFAPQILFRPTTTESNQTFSLARFGDYGVLPGGFDWEQMRVAGLMNDGIAMNHELTNIVQSNLSSYRQQTMPKQGNPVTAREVMYEASQQSALSKTQFNRYYEQLDRLYGEMYRRLSKPNSTCKFAKDFQKACQARGVPKEALGKTAKVEATRIVGQGSAFMRKQSLQVLWATLGPTLPENGRDNLISDIIGAEAGQSAVERYYGERASDKMASDQQAEAMQWVGLMKIGIPPLITASQNPVTFAATFLNAGSQALQSLSQGANPAEVLSFLELDGPATLAQLRRFESDPSRADLHKQMMDQWKQMASLTDKLRNQLKANAEQRAQQAQKANQAMTDEQIKVAKAKSDIAIKEAKTKAQIGQSAQKHGQKMLQSRQDMAIKDATAAAEIRRKNAMASAEKSEESA